MNFLSGTRPPACESAADYHQRTKHRPGAFAAGPGAMDWATQPDPFRHFHEAPVLPLSPAQPLSDASFPEIAAGRLPPAEPLSSDAIGRLLLLSMGISAWKRYGASRWALRCNPSSGNLHPTETYLVLGALPGVAPGVHHYLPREHALEGRCLVDEGAARRLTGALPDQGFLVAFTGIPWREAWKYGERAWRYCLLDLGHALAALHYSAGLLGWRVMSLDGWADATVAHLSGIDREADFPPEERELPELVVQVTAGGGRAGETAPEEVLSCLAEGHWSGPASRLSPGHAHRWPVIDEAARLARKPETRPGTVGSPGPWPAPLPHAARAPAAGIIRQRRSAQAFDGATVMPSADFFRLLDHCLPRPGLPPWGDGPARIHLVLFVHRVADLPRGLYLLAREKASVPGLTDALNKEFLWRAVPGAPADLPLYLLAEGDTRVLAGRLACVQDIAADGAFAAAMLSEFEAGLARGPWGYRRLLQEAGLVGQVLYLEAEAAGLQGTGIGCFFDDLLHEVLGITNTRYQVVYQFTVGKARVDTRITTEPPYPDRKTE